MRRDDPYAPTARAIAAAAKKETIAPLPEHVRTLDRKILAQGIAALRRVLRSGRSDDQGGYSSFSSKPLDTGERWGFVSSGIGQATPAEHDTLFALAGITPDEIGAGEPSDVGQCSTCGNAKEAHGARHERGYSGPCLYCKRPLMSHWVPIGQLLRRKDGKPWLPEEER